MCRQTVMCGAALAAFGLGFLLSVLLQSNVVCVLIGVAGIGTGCILIRKR